MKRILFFIVLILSIGQAACERDDICAESTPTTPLLIIRFFDSENPSEFKAVNNLLVFEAGDTLGFNTDSIAIPLRTDIDMTTFTFTTNFNDTDETTEENTDRIIFNYQRTEDYVSKACGFRVTYSALQLNRQPLTDGAWIDNFEIVNPTIDNEATAHIRIFH